MIEVGPEEALEAEEQVEVEPLEEVALVEVVSKEKNLYEDLKEDPMSEFDVASTLTKETDLRDVDWAQSP